MDGIVMRVTLLPLRVTEETITLPEEEEEILTELAQEGGGSGEDEVNSEEEGEVEGVLVPFSFHNLAGICYKKKNDRKNKVLFGPSGCSPSATGRLQIITNDLCFLRKRILLWGWGE